MRPILISGHERALTQVKYNCDGDLLFSVSKDHIICAWFSNNGERLGTYKGHVGALWTISPDPTSTILASGGADNSLKIWDIQTGKCLQTWDFPTAIKRVEFSEDGSLLLGVTEQRMGHLGTIRVFDMPGVDRATGEVMGEFPEEARLTITLERSKATVAGFSALNEFVVACHEDGSVSQWDPFSGEHVYTTSEPPHSELITDMQWSPDRTYFLTSSKDKSAKLLDAKTLEVLKTYVADTPVNSAAITPIKDFVILGGGQAAMDVTTTAARQGKFEARIYHKVFEEEVGRVRGHFGPLNTVAVHPLGTGYCSGGEDGYVRIHHFDKPYFEFQYEVEREAEREAARI